MSKETPTQPFWRRWLDALRNRLRGGSPPKDGQIVAVEISADDPLYDYKIIVEALADMIGRSISHSDIPREIGGVKSVTFSEIIENKGTAFGEPIVVFSAKCLVGKAKYTVAIQRTDRTGWTGHVLGGEAFTELSVKIVTEDEWYSLELQYLRGVSGTFLKLTTDRTPDRGSQVSVREQKEMIASLAHPLTVLADYLLQHSANKPPADNKQKDISDYLKLK